MDGPVPRDADIVEFQARPL